METHIPDVEILIVFKWMVVLMFSASLAQLSSLFVKRWWYGKEKQDRRDDVQESRGWIERFLDNQKAHTEAMVAVSKNMDQILSALKDNGDIIRDFTRSAECKFEEHRKR